MNRRTFIAQTSQFALSALAMPSLMQPVSRENKMNRLAMGTLLWRSQFKETGPKNANGILDEMRLIDVPKHHAEKFGIRKIEFWSEHIASFEPAYISAIRKEITQYKCELLDIQFDSSPFNKTGYDLASPDEAERAAGVAHVKKWMDGASLFGSKCVRINPGKNGGSVNQSIRSFQELLPYAKRKGLIIITANHFGIETDPDKHVAIVKGAPGIYTEPDFGNYNGTANMYDSLAKIIPYAYIVSAKMVDFKRTPEGLQHVSYDFDKCVQLAEDLGFKGTYMVAQWSSREPDAGITNADIAKWGIERIIANMK